MSWRPTNGCALGVTGPARPVIMFTTVESSFNINCSSLHFKSNLFLIFLKDCFVKLDSPGSYLVESRVERETLDIKKL